MSKQSGWGWCQKCQAMVCSLPLGDQYPSVCPAGGTHDTSRSGSYAMPWVGPSGPPQGGQDGWRWCKNCAALFFDFAAAGVDGPPSLCPAVKEGGTNHAPIHMPHDASKSGRYYVRFGDGLPGMQSGWRWCCKCNGLFFAVGATQGVCPAGGAHDGGKSAQYGAIWDLPATLHFHDDIVTPSGDPLGGSVNVDLSDDGTVTITAHIHDAGWSDMKFTLAIGIVTPTGSLYHAEWQGSVEGTETSVVKWRAPNRDTYWNAKAQSAAIVSNWETLGGSRLVWKFVDQWANLDGMVTLLKQLAPEVGSAIIALL